MIKTINILLVEDSPDDEALLIDELKTAGFAPNWKRVETEADYLAQLKTVPELILSDYSMPQFSGLRAAQILREQKLDIPFILISGTVGEDVAVEAMKQGATDYLLKDRLVRLGSAVERALEQKRMRDESRRVAEALNLFRMLVDRSTDGIEVIDPETGRFLDINETTCQRLGYTREELLSKTVSDIDFVSVSPASWAKNVGEIRQLGVKVLEGMHRRKDGSTFPVEINVRHVKLDRDYLIAAVRDISERKQAEAALRGSELKFRQLAENINEVFWITDPAKHQMIYISPAYEKIWGRSCESLFASPQSWVEAIHPEDRPKILEAVMTRQAEGAYDEEYRIVRPDKSIRWVRDRAFPVRNPAGQVERIVGVAADITEKRKLEEEFRQSQKMEAIGQLASGVAHDFNNILAVIQMQVGLLSVESNLSPGQRDFAVEIGNAAQHAADLTRQLLLFSRRQTIQPRELDLNAAVVQLNKMLHRILGEDIRMKIKKAPQPLYICADPGMIDQVLMNLAVNSRDAMPKGGSLTVEISAAEFDERQAAQIPQARAGSFVCLSVGDTGCGIPPEVLPKIFDPFFTTKEVGKGTGLGLATVFGIVHQHQGWINVSSKVGEGTTFRIYIPRLAKFSGEKSKEPIKMSMRGGKETILVVEDDSSLRDLVENALTRLGYRVLQASSGVQALKVWKEHGGKIDLLFTDMIMPDGMNGKDLAGKLLADNPKLKVIYASGYSADILGKDSIIPADVNFLVKPFDLLQLAKIVRNCLDHPASKGEP